MTRDQQRAVFAYGRVALVPRAQREDYKIAVNSLGANILRSGLVAAIADLERRSKGEPSSQNAATLLMEHLAAAQVPNVTAPVGARVRALEVQDYMVATRELLQVTMWLKRAVQAVIPDDEIGAANA